MTRYRLAHLCPEDPDRQAANLNAAYQATAGLLEAARQAARRAAPAPRPLALIVAKDVASTDRVVGCETVNTEPAASE